MDAAFICVAIVFPAVGEVIHHGLLIIFGNFLESTPQSSKGLSTITQQVRWVFILQFFDLVIHRVEECVHG